MRLPTTWLLSFLEQALASTGQHRASRSGGGDRLRRAVLRVVHRRGLAYGTPLLPDGRALSSDVGPIQPLLRYVDALTEASLVLGAHAQRVDDDDVRRAVLAALAALYTDGSGADELTASPKDRAFQRAVVRLGDALRAHRYLSGNPLVGLTLHHALVAVDAAACLELMAASSGDSLSPDLVGFVKERRDREQDALVAAIGRLTYLRDDVDAELLDGAVGWHIKHLGVARPRVQKLLKLARDEGSPEAFTRHVPGGAEERHLLQLMMVARIDGRVSPEERALLNDVAERLDIPPDRADRMLARVERFCAAHRARLDPLALAAAFEIDGGPVPTRVARYLRANVHDVWKEIRETGDLAVLLAKRSAGQRLNADESRRMREQLLDVARVIPGLAVFTLPGGALLLPVLVKILPFDLRPSSFRPGDFRAFEDDAEKAEDAHAR